MAIEVFSPFKQILSKLLPCGGMFILTPENLSWRFVICDLMKGWYFFSTKTSIKTFLSKSLIKSLMSLIAWSIFSFFSLNCHNIAIVKLLRDDNIAYSLMFYSGIWQIHLLRNSLFPSFDFEMSLYSYILLFLFAGGRGKHHQGCLLVTLLPGRQGQSKERGYGDFCRYLS